MVLRIWAVALCVGAEAADELAVEACRGRSCGVSAEAYVHGPWHCAYRLRPRCNLQL